jgi:hypothetical protein
VDRLAVALLGPVDSGNEKLSLGKRFLKGLKPGWKRAPALARSGQANTDREGAPISLRALREEVAGELQMQLAPRALTAQKASPGSRALALGQVDSLEQAQREGLGSDMVLVALRAVLDEFARRVRLAPRHPCIHCGGCCWAMFFEPQLTLRGRRHLLAGLYELDELGRLFAGNNAGEADDEFWNGGPAHVLQRGTPAGLGDDASPVPGVQGHMSSWDGECVRLPRNAAAYYCAIARQLIGTYY